MAADERTWRGLLRLWGGRLALLGVVAIAVAVGIDAVRGSGDEAARPVAAPRPELVGPSVPQPGVLDGTLTVAAGETCRLETVGLADASLGREGPRTACDLWAAPRGTLAAVTRGHNGLWNELWLARLGDSPRLLQELGFVQGDPSWSPGGKQLAWCGPEGTTTVLTVATGQERIVRGCRPALTAEGVLTRPSSPIASKVLLDGRAILDQLDLTRPFRVPDATIDVLGFDRSLDGLLAVAVVTFDDTMPRAVLELWRGRTLEGSLALPLLVVPGRGVLGELVRFSPTGGEVVVGFAGAAIQLLVVDALRRRIALEPTPSSGFAWSPDGAWLARSTGTEIVISGAERSEAVYVLPLEAWGLAWR